MDASLIYTYNCFQLILLNKIQVEESTDRKSIRNAHSKSTDLKRVTGK